MSDNKAVKKVFLGKTEGRRKAVRPKLRWFDYIKYDIKPMGVKRGRKTADCRFM